MRDALKSFHFRKKRRCAKKNFLFILSNCHGNAFFMKEFKWEIFYESHFHRFRHENIVYLAFKFVVNKNRSGWLTTSHSAHILLSVLLFTFLDWTGWDVCFIVTLAPLESKASSTLTFRNAINLKLVVGTYMGRAMEKTS